MMLEKILKKYRKYVVLVDPRISRYVRAEKELKLALALSPASLTPVILYYVRLLDADLTVVASLSALLLVSSAFRVLETLTSVSSINKKLDDELPFAVLTATAASKTGLEFIEFLKFVSTSRVFKSFKSLGERFVKLAEIVGVAEALTTLSRITSGKTKYFLIEYSVALNSGTALSQLRDYASDFMKTISSQITRSISFRVNAGITTCVGLTIGPLVALSMTFLVGEELTSFVVPLLVLAGFLTTSLFPDYPVGLQAVIDEKLLKVFRASYVAGTALLVFPLQHLIEGDVAGFTRCLQQASVASLVLGLLPATLQLRAVLNTVVGRVVSRASNHVRVFRSLQLYEDRELEETLKKRVRSWLILYLSEALAFLKQLGDCDPEVFEVFVNFVYEVRRTLWQYIAALTIMTSVIFLAPFLIASTATLGCELASLTNTLLVSYTSLLVLGYSVSKIVLGKNLSTTYPALTTLIFTVFTPIK